MKQTEKEFPYTLLGIIFIILSVLTLTGVFIVPDTGFKMKIYTIAINIMMWFTYASILMEKWR